MEIINHRLKDIAQKETPNKGGIIEPKYLVFHYTADKSANNSIDWLCNPETKASYTVTLY